MKEISVVIPAYNEEKNIPLLHKKLSSVLSKLHKDYEIIFVDDGSKDATAESIKLVCAKDSKVKGILFRRTRYLYG